ncbi:MAG: glycosyltransferase family 2 protein [Candidatus Kerfeldbacteria bacterium]|nr:glycosyltransferase family 2 protein [Candidatus Kerfeldbacteria bacterium]
MNHRRERIIAVLPAYNAAKTLERTVADIPRDWVDDIVVVDDASQDNTMEVARKLGLHTVVHPKNRGYGGNQKTCYRLALERRADIVVMVHPDHQYDPTAIPLLLAPILADAADAVFGSRMMTPGAARAGGMPLWKYLANKALTAVANRRLGLNLTEYHSGFRAYSRRVLATIPLEENSDDFVFDTEIILQLIARGFRISEVPITTRYFKDASSIGLRRSVVYGLAILRCLWNYQGKSSVSLTKELQTPL